jgi:hypothetical protein
MPESWLFSYFFFVREFSCIEKKQKLLAVINFREYNQIRQCRGKRNLKNILKKTTTKNKVHLMVKSLKITNYSKSECVCVCVRVFSPHIDRRHTLSSLSTKKKERKRRRGYLLSEHFVCLLFVVFLPFQNSTQRQLIVFYLI